MLIETRGLRRRFPDGAVGLDGASLELGRPGLTVISGPNGSGKSLLIRCILGLEPTDGGEILLDGEPLGSRLAELRRRVALVFQEPEHQILGVTVREDAEFGPRAAGLKPESYGPAVDAALRRAGLEGMGERLASALSGGEKRRLALASALVAEPELVILDEPFNDLDWRGASDLLRAILALKDGGASIALVTHDLEKCLAHADRLVVMDGGRVVREGGPRELWEELPVLGLRRPGGGPERLSEMSWLMGESL